MTITERDEPATTDVLDLYDVLPHTVVHPEKAEDDPVTAMIKAAGRNFAALVGLFAVFLRAFPMSTTLFRAGGGLAFIGVGLFILIGARVVAGWAARMTRSLLGYAG